MKRRTCQHCGTTFYSQYDDAFCPQCWKQQGKEKT